MMPIFTIEHQKPKIMAIGIQQMILDFYKSPEFQKLSAYYGQSTMFDVLGVQRSENRHSDCRYRVVNAKSSLNRADDCIGLNGNINPAERYRN